MAARTTLALTVVVLVVNPLAAVAHDSLVGTSPRDGATVGRTPPNVRLRFSEPVLPIGATVLVRGPGGQQIDDGPPPLVDRSLVSQSLRPGAPAGRYSVLWRVTSSDGHPISGSFSFTSTQPGQVGAPAVTHVPAPVPTGSAPTAGRAGRDERHVTILGLGVVALVTGAVFTLVRRRNRP